MSKKMMKSAIFWLPVVVSLKSVHAKLGAMHQEETRRELKVVKVYGSNPRNRYPLGECEGDCDNDGHCEEGLICHQRGKNDPVPGCNGGRADDSRTDYCIVDPEASSPRANEPPAMEPATEPNTDSFRLKMFWKEGYLWQEEKFERKWCMQCLDGCRSEHQVWITECSDSSTYFQFDYVTDNEFLIKVDERDLCLERSNEEEKVDIFLQSCDQNKSRQKWITYNGLSTGNEFEIHQKSFPKHCITQHHHPKHGEIIDMQRLVNARVDDSSQWNKY